MTSQLGSKQTCVARHFATEDHRSRGLKAAARGRGYY